MAVWGEQPPTATMLLSAEAAVEAAAESVAILGMDADDFAALAKAKLIEIYVASAKRKIREQEEKIAHFEKQLESLRRNNKKRSRDSFETTTTWWPASPEALPLSEPTASNSVDIAEDSDKTVVGRAHDGDPGSSPALPSISSI